MNLPRGFPDLLAQLDLPPRLRADLLRRMGEPWRGYHGLNHLAVLWARHCRYARGGPMQQARATRLIAATILFHDTILVPGARDNEARSAALWRRAARRIPGLTPAEIAWVTETIQATVNHLATPFGKQGMARIRSWFLDLDLTPIGEEPTVFRRNSAGLRAEMRHVEEAAYDRGQIRFLTKLAEAPEILRTPRLRAAFERRARENIAAEQKRAARRDAARQASASRAKGRMRGAA